MSLFHRIALGTVLALSAASAFTDISTPVGMWQTIDDASGEPKAAIQITQDGNGELSGKIMRGIGKLNDPERRTACKGDRKDQLLKGMTIIEGMRQDGDEWNGGQILDPESGKFYKSSAR